MGAALSKLAAFATPQNLALIAAALFFRKPVKLLMLQTPQRFNTVC